MGDMADTLLAELDAQMSDLIGTDYDNLNGAVKDTLLTAIANTLELHVDLFGDGTGGGGGGGGAWSASGYTGTVNYLAGFDGAGAATYVNPASYATAGHNHSGVYQPVDSALTDISGLSPSTDDMLIFDGANWNLVAKGIFSLAGHNHAGVYQPVDADLTTIAALSPSTGDLLYYSGGWTTTASSGFATSSHNHNGVYQPLDSDLTTIAGLTPSTGDLLSYSGGWTLTAGSTFATAGHNHTGTYQPLDGDLTDIAALAPADGHLMKRVAGHWSSVADSAYELAANKGAASGYASLGSDTRIPVIQYGMIRAVQGSDATTTSNTTGTTTSLAVSLSANKKYRLYGVMPFTTALGTTGIGFMLSGSTPTLYCLNINIQDGGGVLFGCPALSGWIQTANQPTGGAVGFANIQGYIDVGASPITYTLNVRSEVSGSSVSMKAGAFLEAVEVG